MFYHTTLKNPLIWPPQDGSSIKYDYLKTLSKKKVITQNSEQEIEMEVGPSKVGFISFSQSGIQQALFVKENGEDNMKPLIDIEGFDYQEGYKYKLKVQKVIQAEPYSLKYILMDILSKEQE